MIKKYISLVVLVLVVSGCQQSGGELTTDKSEKSGTIGEAQPFEEIGRSETLEGAFGHSWLFAHDMNFNTLGRAKIMVLDGAAENSKYRGAIDADQFATFQQPSKRNHLLVAETFYSNDSWGKRTNELTIYNHDMLKVEDEVLLTDNNRAQSATENGSFQLTHDEKFVLIYTFTPATGVAFVDLGSRKLVNQTDIPSCTLIHPRGQRGFASLCEDGSMVAFDLSKTRQITEKHQNKQFNDIGKKAMFMKFVKS
ncbi:MAG: hypothetical protein COA41_06115 [Sphingopyxis sp.]|jgi:methylamine dehydrogenase heavy chain|nr:MAG: hypothetical protein COA41_06115 [Sphingopyxis sp.]|tara:strand:+ start:3491 stop:4249 length:759 start_codon:yes stop_codon:yes gene_type:complete